MLRSSEHVKKNVPFGVAVIYLFCVFSVISIADVAYT